MRKISVLTILSIFFVLGSFHPVGVRNFKVAKIVIDPGHGGTDPGTRGAFIVEKDICLKVALQVGQYIEENIPDVEVIYTRKKDATVDLYKRPQIANKHNADLFISIHANSLPEKTPAQRKKVIRRKL
jgi:N-acetylmuramoyl-L-alanine amidase